ncbi:hypothetical protein J437_LFUL004585 [Ladona fulva]|uniref:Phospholipase A2 n=1 Tax=Ladona fulva TaxID=123851 RepID=A0A8K0JUG2_LADFU|nr:hypothetical protein J437_LFUL004585 [Ladona fulva]
MEQLTFQTETKSQVLSSLNWTTPSTEGDYNNSMGKKDDIENETTYIGYGHNPWGPSTLMSSEENGGSRSKGRNPQRPRRDVVHLYNMVSCATGCNPIIYKGYGCYCGFLGSGAPIDGIDRCCKMHDWCYNTANCPMFFEYIIPYYWKCYHHRPICGIDEDYI